LKKLMLIAIKLGSTFGAVSQTHPAEHIAVGVFGGTKPASTTRPDPLLAISDHCPMVAKLTL
jgi:hypothetical protein